MGTGVRIENREFTGTERQRLDGSPLVEADVLARIKIARNGRIEPADADDLLARERNLDVEVFVMNLGSTRPPGLERRLLTIA